MPSALRMFKAAAEKGCLTSQHMLGGIYCAGAGVEKDPVEGKRWLRQAADAGHEPSAKLLAELRTAP